MYPGQGWTGGRTPAQQPGPSGGFEPTQHLAHGGPVKNSVPPGFSAWNPTGTLPRLWTDKLRASAGLTSHGFPHEWVTLRLPPLPIDTLMRLYQRVRSPIPGKYGTTGVQGTMQQIPGVYAASGTSTGARGGFFG